MINQYSEEQRHKQKKLISHPNLLGAVLGSKNWKDERNGS